MAAKPPPNRIPPGPILSGCAPSQESGRLKVFLLAACRFPEETKDPPHQYPKSHTWGESGISSTAVSPVPGRSDEILQIVWCESQPHGQGRILLARNSALTIESA